MIMQSQEILATSQALHYDKIVRNGIVAQLGERCVRNAEVEGSNPFGSIP